MNETFENYLFRANQLRQSGKLDEKIAAASKAIELGSNRAVFHCQLGLYLEHQQDLDGAIMAYARAVQLEPKLIAAFCHLEAVWTKQKI